MSITIITPPTEEPITLTQVKVQVRVDDAASDDLLTSLIAAARQHVEARTGRGLITQTRVLRLGDFPEQIVLREGLLQAISSVTYVDVDGVVQTLDETAFQVDPYSDPPRIMAAYASIWPTTRCQPNAVTVTYVCGYADAASVPNDIKAALLMIVADLFANREASVIGATYVETTAVTNLLAPHMSYAS